MPLVWRWQASTEGKHSRALPAPSEAGTVDFELSTGQPAVRSRGCCLGAGLEGAGHTTMTGLLFRERHSVAARPFHNRATHGRMASRSD